MPRLRRYASAIVPAIGCDMANRRRAASGDPRRCRTGRGDFGPSARVAAGCRKRRASSSDVAEVDQDRDFADEVEEVAVLAGGGVGPFAGGALADCRSVQPDEQAAARRVARRRRPASSGPRGGRWRDSGGTPPRHRARGGAPVRRLATTSRRLTPPPVGDADERIALHHLAPGSPDPLAPVGTNMRSFQEMISGIRPHRLQPVDHAVGEAGELDAEVRP